MTDKICIRTFGKFEITYKGETIRLERSQSTKTAQLLQYLMVHQGQSFEKEDLVNILYRENEVSDPLNNLKVNIFRLRQMLANSSLPAEKFILHRRGCYSWNEDLPLEVDLDQYRRLLDHAVRSDLSSEDRVALMIAAIELYQGEFLPELRSEPWVEKIDAECQKRYLEAVTFVVEYYRQMDDAQRENAILNQAVAFFPYDEKLREMQLRSLIDHKMFREAMTLYDEISRQMMDELGLVPTQEMAQMYQILVGEMDTPVTTFSEIRNDICEEKAAMGAYNCSYVAFIDTARLLARYLQRSGQPAYFVLCTLVDSAGAVLPAGTRLREAAAAAGRSIRNSLRRGDLYTRYGPSQFLLLLIGITQENCGLVIRRIEQQFGQEVASRGLNFRWEIETISSIVPEEKETETVG